MRARLLALSLLFLLHPGGKGPVPAPCAPGAAVEAGAVLCVPSPQLAAWRLLARHAGKDAGDLYRVAGMETGGTYRPDIVSPSGKYLGLYQFDARTWRASREGAGLHPDAAPTDPESAVRAAVWLWRQPGGPGHWPCARRLRAGGGAPTRGGNP